MRRAILAASLLLAVSACGGEFYRTVKLQPDEGAGTSIVTDARLRVISNLTPGTASRPGLVDPTNIVCVEPSPDVAVAAANSMGASAGIAGKGSFALSGATAEGLAQIAERTTAIQAILRQGYQACIDYMNGAISGTTYSLRQSRLDDLLVTLVLAEDAAGAFGRSGAFIGTESSSSARAAATYLPEINKSLDQANSDLAAKQEAVVKAQQERDDAQKALEENDETADPDKEKQLQTTLDAKEANLRTKIAERDLALSKVSGLTEAATNAAAGVTQIAGLGGIEAQPDPEIARSIAGMQETFVNKDVEQSYVSACLIELGQWKVRDGEDDFIRHSAMKKLVRALDDIDLRDKTEPDLQDYFLATQLGQHTLLTNICEATLGPVMFRAQANAHDRKLKVLEIEAKRVELALQHSDSAPVDSGEGVHPLKSLNEAVVVKAALDKALSELPPVPAVSDNFTAEQKKEFDGLRKTAEDEAKAISAEMGKLVSDPQKTAVQSLENDYILLIADARRTGTKAELEVWSLAFEAQQKQAALLARQYSDIMRKAKGATTALIELKRRIEAVAK